MNILKNQRPWLTAFAGLMALDTLITAWGVLARPDFAELNPLFSQFVHSPGQFIAVIIMAKLAVIAAVVLLVAWMNARQDRTFGRATGDVLVMTATGGMAVMMAALGIVNVMVWLG